MYLLIKGLSVLLASAIKFEYDIALQEQSRRSKFKFSHKTEAQNANAISQPINYTTPHDNKVCTQRPLLTYN